MWIPRDIVPRWSAGTRSGVVLTGVHERRAGRVSSLFFWRDRTREVDFVVDIGGHLELFEAKWTEAPTAADAVNLDFVRKVVVKSGIAGGAIISLHRKQLSARKRLSGYAC